LESNSQIERKEASGVMKTRRPYLLRSSKKRSKKKSKDERMRRRRSFKNE
jgi:hypothetical protein